MFPLPPYRVRVARGALHIVTHTEFPRADGHVIWAHMDQWEGQNLTRSPGNLFSDVRKVHLDPGQGYRIKLDLEKDPTHRSAGRHVMGEADQVSKSLAQPLLGPADLHWRNRSASADSNLDTLDEDDRRNGASGPFYKPDKTSKRKRTTT
jgi:hypothetical protein